MSMFRSYNCGQSKTWSIEQSAFLIRISSLSANLSTTVATHVTDLLPASDGSLLHDCYDVSSLTPSSGDKLIIKLMPCSFLNLD